MSKWVYGFGAGRDEGGAGLQDLLGAKGAGLARMAGLGLPVPPGFTITTEVCTAFLAEGRRSPDGLEEQVGEALARVEEAVGLQFGRAERPLLLSVRSGARVSMPGMMDTVLDLGLNDETLAGLARHADDPRFAWDCYRRFVQMYGSTVLGVDHHRFEEIIEEIKLEGALIDDAELAAEDWERVVEAFTGLIEGETKRAFPSDPHEQLWGAIGAVFGSWNSERARIYRRLHDIPAAWGTAVTVQAMVFGNMGARSATGVCFTRDPSTGENVLYGEYLPNAQGEDVVSGIRTPRPLSRRGAKADEVSMQDALPASYAELMRVRAVLERHCGDMQDIEFTVQRDRLFVLQTRAGKRTAAASVRIAVEMAQSGLIGRHEAITRVQASALEELLHPMLDPEAARVLLAKGLPASPGAVSGGIVFSSREAERRAAAGERVILVRAETSPDDIGGMHAARGVLTLRGGMTSHAAVIARGMGRACVTGAGGMSIAEAAGTLSSGGRTLREGDIVTIDGASGEVFVGEVATVEPTMPDEVATLMGWADAVRQVGVRANASTVAEAQLGLRLGAEGVGLCRTEQMLLDAGRIGILRRAVAADEAGRGEVLLELLALQREDFGALFRVVAGLPVTVGLFNPPPEFAPLARAVWEIQVRAMLESAATVAREGLALPLLDVVVAADAAAELVGRGGAGIIGRVGRMGETTQAAGFAALGSDTVFGVSEESVEFVSCAPGRVPVARLAAAQLAGKAGALPQAPPGGSASWICIRFTPMG